MLVFSHSGGVLGIQPPGDFEVVPTLSNWFIGKCLSSDGTLEGLDDAGLGLGLKC